MPTDEIEDAVDKVVAPDRIMRWIVRIVLLVVLISVAVTVTKLALHTTNKIDEAVTTDATWFSTQFEAIEAAKLEERAAREALERHQADVAARSGPLTFSRADDRVTTQNLNQQILEIQRRRLELIKAYNARVQGSTDQAMLGQLPRHIPLE